MAIRILPLQHILVIWSVLLVAVLVPIALAATSPFLASRNAAYITAGFAGVICLSLFLIQPLLAAGYLPGPSLAQTRKWHRLTGCGILIAVFLHVGGLFVTSPPDTLDALLLVSPTPFSVYGVIAMWGVLLTAGLVVLRKHLGLRYTVWSVIHNALAAIVVLSTVAHALQIDGTMERMSKWILCAAVVVVAGVVLLDLRVLRPILRRRSNGPKA